MTITLPPEVQESLTRAIEQAKAMGYERAGKPTDDELAMAWLNAHPKTAYGLGEFRRYTRGTWPVVADGQVEQEILEVLDGAKRSGIRPRAPLLASVKKLAQVMCYQPPTVWDANPDILVCHNGTLHIPSMTLRPHSPNDWQTSAVEYDYDPAARAPVWESVITDLENRLPGVGGFLQEFAGYCLTTDTRYEIAIWLHGPSGAGKSTILAGLRAMLGARCGVLGLADIERHRFALSHIPGKTLLISTEQPGCFMQSTHIVNCMISGEPITVDRKFRDPVEVVPRAKIAWAMNELPRIGGASDGLFRRVKVITLPPLAAAPDPEIKLRIAEEGAGILNWALAGLRRLRERRGFALPECVRVATARFKESNDIPAMFVGECCVVGNEYKTRSQQLYDAYKAWCIANGHKPASSTSIVEDWERLGFVKHRAAGTSWWHGVGLRADVAGVAGVATSPI